MGHRTLSLDLVLRAWFLDETAYDRLRDDDNPFVEGAFLIALIGLVTALLSLIGQLLAWASSPSLDAIRQVVLQTLQTMPWWQAMASNPQALAAFNQYWDLGWRIFPFLFQAPSPTTALINVVVWPVTWLLGWLVYGVLAYLFARLLSGRGTLNQTLGTTALAATPLLLHGLGFIPFLVLGGVVNTWQLICRYRAIRSAQGLTVARAFWATILPFAVYLLLWIVLGLLGATLLGAFLRR